MKAEVLRCVKTDIKAELFYGVCLCDAQTVASGRAMGDYWIGERAAWQKRGKIPFVIMIRDSFVVFSFNPDKFF